MSGNFLLIYICNFHVLSSLLLIYICKLHWNLQSIRVLKFFRLLNPYGLYAPSPSVLGVMNAIGETADRVVLLIVMILIVMVTAALLANKVNSL